MYVITGVCSYKWYNKIRKYLYFLDEFASVTTSNTKPQSGKTRRKCKRNEKVNIF